MEQRIGLQKHEAGGKCRAFIAVDEGVIAAQVEKVGGRDLDGILDERLACEGCLGSGDGRFEERRVASARRAAVRAKNPVVNPNYRFGCQVTESPPRQGAGRAPRWP